MSPIPSTRSEPAEPARANRRRVVGVYLITPDWSDDDRLLDATRSALDAGVGVLQYRHKQADGRVRLRQATALRALTRAHRALLIVNDDAGLAVTVGADGVHLGRDDRDPTTARAERPEGMLLGVSCYNDLARARAAAAAGADYVAFGSVFASATKPDAVRASPDLLGHARREGMQVVAIGGIGIDNIARVAAVGAHAAALISAVYDAADPGAAARALVEEFERGRRLHESQRATV